MEAIAKDRNGKLLVWIDIETTGLNCEQCDILELAVAITTPNAEECLAQSSTVFQLPTHLVAWDDWALQQHEKSGLLKQCRNSTEPLNSSIAFAAIETAMVQAFRDTYPQHDMRMPSDFILAGRGLHFDRSFLEHLVPGFSRMFSRRHLDVQALDQFAMMAFPDVYASRPRFEPTHRAMTDVLDAIRLYQYYQDAFGKKAR